MDTDHAIFLRELGVIGQKLDGLCANVDEIKDISTKRLDAHATDIRSLEKSRAWGRGRDSVCVVLIAAAIAWVKLYWPTSP